MSNATDTEFTVTDEFLAAIKAAAKNKAYGVSHTLVASVVRDSHGTVGEVALAADINRKDKFGVGHYETRQEQKARGRIERYDDTTGLRHVASQSRYLSGERGSAIVTLASLLRKGDELLVHFTIGNSTDNLKSAGLAQDDCDIVVIRKGQIVGTAHVDTRIAPTYSAGGRMVDFSFRPSAVPA